MKQNLDIELKVIKKFVDKAKQHRYVQFVSSTKNRHKFISELPHFNSFRLDLFTPVYSHAEQAILEVLQNNGVADKTCYIVSENKDIDTKTLNTKEAISEVLGYGMGTILVFGDAEIIFFEGEEMNSRFISKRII